MGEMIIKLLGVKEWKKKKDGVMGVMKWNHLYQKIGRGQTKNILDLKQNAENVPIMKVW